MNTKWLIFTLFLFDFNRINAQLVAITDSLFVDHDEDQQVYLLHKVNKKEGLLSISRLYSASPEQIIQSNALPQNPLLQEGQQLRIPFKKALPSNCSPLSNQLCIPLYYLVKPKESLFQICRRKFDLNQKEVLRMNHLSDHRIQSGSLLLLGYWQLSKVSEDLVDPLTPSPEIKPSINPIHAPKEETEAYTHHSKGVAIWQSASFGEGRMFALHNEARMESYIEVSNPILNRKIKAKVIGRIPPIFTSDVQVVLSAEAARQLGTIDKRFFVYIQYR